MRGGTFADGDPGELVDFVDRKIVGRGVGGRLLSRVEGVEIRVSTEALKRAERKAAKANWPYVRIYAPSLARSTSRMYLGIGKQWSPPQVLSLLTAGGVTIDGPPTSGTITFPVADSATGAEVVGLALTALRALGSPGPGGWEWEQMLKDSNTPT